MSVTKSSVLTMVCTAGLLTSVMAFAEPDPAKFQEHKADIISHLQEKQQLVQKHLNCVQAAQDPAALKVCQETAKQEHDVLAGKMKALKDQNKAQKPAEMTH